MFDDLMIPEGTIFGVSSSCTPSLHAWCDIVLGLLQRSQPADQPRCLEARQRSQGGLTSRVLGSVKFSTSIAPLSFQVRSTFLPSRCACRFEIPVVTVDWFAKDRKSPKRVWIEAPLTKQPVLQSENRRTDKPWHRMAPRASWIDVLNVLNG